MKSPLTPPVSRALGRWSVMAAAVLLAGCDMLGIETAAQIAEQRDAEGRAIGSACRHAVRSIEDCYRTNPKASKSSIFAGWRDMDQYMRENNIQGMPSSDSPTAPVAAAESDKKPAEKPAGETPAKTQ